MNFCLASSRTCGFLIEFHPAAIPNSWSSDVFFLKNEWMPGITQTLLRHMFLPDAKFHLGTRRKRNPIDKKKDMYQNNPPFWCLLLLPTKWLSVVYSQIPKDWTNPYFGDALKWQAFFEQMMIFVQCCGHFFSVNHLNVKRWRKFRADRELG